ncbi:MAG: hypothetical protein QMD22_11625, partial [archaeon]|nr:hypothetical protein [archaeon]
KSSKTTEIYTHVSNKDIGKIKSPLDRLFENKEGGVKTWLGNVLGRKSVHPGGCIYEVLQIYCQSGRIYEIRIYRQIGVIYAVLQIYRSYVQYYSAVAFKRYINKC